jgi:hypothetical protein
MANTQAMCTSFKGELLVGHHNFGTGVVRAATTADTFKAALYLASATVNASTTAYSSYWRGNRHRLHRRRCHSDIWHSS